VAGDATGDSEDGVLVVGGGSVGSAVRMKRSAIGRCGRGAWMCSEAARRVWPLDSTPRGAEEDAERKCATKPDGAAFEPFERSIWALSLGGGGGGEEGLRVRDALIVDLDLDGGAVEADSVELKVFEGLANVTAGLPGLNGALSADCNGLLGRDTKTGSSESLLGL
jgi:hypothetical protein